jgi:hypothetical protein
MPEMLTVELLARLDQALRDLGASIVDHWDAGLTRAQMDALTEPYGFRLPDEAATWWGWHNGAAHGKEISPHREPLSLNYAMQSFEIREGAMSDAFGLTRLVSVLSEQPWLWFDCRGPRDALVPVYAGYKADEPWVAAESIGDMVLVLIAAFESGAFTTDERGEWNETDRSKIPAAIEGLGIA